MGPQPKARPDHPGGVDLYVGGVEHAVLHLLYARFWHKVLFDLGHVSSNEPYRRLFNQGYILACAYKDERGIYVEADEVVERDGAFFYRGRAGHPRVRQDGQEPEERRLARRHLRRVRRRHACACTRCAMGPLDASRPWETATSSACTGSCSACGATSSTRRPASRASSTRRRRRDAARAAPHDRRRARRHGRAAFNTADRQADRAEQPPHQAGRRRAGRRAAGADGGPAAPAHRRGVVARSATNSLRTAPSRRRPGVVWSTRRSSTRCRSTARSAATSPCRRRRRAAVEAAPWRTRRWSRCWRASRRER